VHLADGRDTFLFEFIYIGWNTACSKNTLIVFELQDLHDINRRKATAYDQGFVRRLAVRPRVVPFILVVVPIDERILVNQALVDEFFRSGYSQFSVPPRSVCQDYRRKAQVNCHEFVDTSACQVLALEAERFRVRAYREGTSEPCRRSSRDRHRLCTACIHRGR
jgi:hypothetical protein